MDYVEHPAPPNLKGLMKARWTLAAGGDRDAWIEQQATPDGCVEIIHRLAGRSRWSGDQPAAFAVGLIERPEPFEISGDARFEAIRLWPWAWPLLSETPLDALRGRWLALPDAPDFVGITAQLGEAEALNTIGEAVIGAASVEAMARATGMSPRRLQRWFARHVGLPPRHYLRLLRFQKAFESVPGQASLAGHAAEAGFADQAHMAREFRALAGTPASRARRDARGPFLP